MRKAMFVLFTLLVGGFAMAQGEGDAAPFFTPGIAMALAAGLCGIAQGSATKAACEGMARNPGAAGDIRTTMIIGLALIESLALYCLVILFVKG